MKELEAQLTFVVIFFRSIELILLPLLVILPGVTECDVTRSVS